MKVIVLVEIPTYDVAFLKVCDVQLPGIGNSLHLKVRKEYKWLVITDVDEYPDSQIVKVTCELGGFMKETDEEVEDYQRRRSSK